MKLNEEEKRELEELYLSFLNNEKIQRMKDIPMHRGSNCYLHSFKVAKLAIRNGLRYKSVDLKKILIASILHDYYLYDWRKDRSLRKKHGSRHPVIASDNAMKDFNIDKSIQKIIKSHMWPINFKNFPDSKEARILGVADKTITIKEASSSKAFKKKKEAYYYNYISKLFK